MNRKHTIFWGWYVAGAAFCILGMNYASRYCFGVFVKPIAEGFGWPRSTVSLSMSIVLLAYGVGGVFAGRLLDRVPAKWLISAGAGVAALGLLLSSLVREPWQLFVSYGLVFGIASSFFGVVVCISYLGRWFVRKRGTAIGLATVGIGAGVVAMTPLVGLVLKTYGWREGFVVLGLLVLVVAVPLSQGFMGRKGPEFCGLLPDGAPGDPAPPGCVPSGEGPVRQISLRDLLGDRRFWVLAGAYSLAVLAEMATLMHQVAYAQDRGIEQVVAAASLGMVGVSSIGGRFFFGWFSDRLADPKYAAFWGFALMAAGMAVLMRAEGAAGLYAYAVVFGFGYGSLAPLMPILLSDRFGRHALAQSYSVLTFFVAVSSSLGPFWSGWIFDTTGSYDLAWKLNLGILSAVTVGILLLRPAARETPFRPARTGGGQGQDPPRP